MRAAVFGVVYLSSTKLKKSTILSGKYHISYPTNEESLSYIFLDRVKELLMLSSTLHTVCGR